MQMGRPGLGFGAQPQPYLITMVSLSRPHDGGHAFHSLSPCSSDGIMAHLPAGHMWVRDRIMADRDAQSGACDPSRDQNVPRTMVHSAAGVARLSLVHQVAQLN